MLPMHFMILMVASKHSPRALWSGLLFALKKHLTPSSFRLSQSPKFPTWKFLRLLFFLTIGATVPSLLWFAAVSLASVTDVTAIWNTNAFFAYILTVKIFKLSWHPKRLAAVVLATLGVMAVVYGGSSAPDPGDPSLEGGHHGALTALSVPRPSAPLIGDLLTLVASVGYGLYQVLYKMYAALPSDPEMQGDIPYTPIATSYEEITDDLEAPLDDAFKAELIYPPPFALYPNFLTSAIGVCTFLFLWIPMPFLHYFGVVHFELPPNTFTVLVIAGIALGGVIFNAGFMVLLGVWGPIVTSVGSLLTIVLVLLSDIVFGGAVGTVTLWSLGGSGIIMVAFAVLAYDMMQAR
ncbi:hypothetical protein B0H21DRAFT_532263 [Amylocystis lapponica]|nr:hypothetical protein B0H21DRAFT_532263 [Amylocystis lapponica]